MKLLLDVGLLGASFFAGLCPSLLSHARDSSRDSATPRVSVTDGTNSAAVLGGCFGCMATVRSDGAPCINPNGICGDDCFSTTGTSCGNAVGLRVTYGAFSGFCDPDTCSPAGPCEFCWELDYFGDCRTFIGGNRCGVPIPVPILPNAPAAPWVHYLSDSLILDCGNACLVRYNIRCQNCTTQSVGMAVKFECTSCAIP